MASYKQFLLYSQCFPQLYIFSASKCSLLWLIVNSSPIETLFFNPTKMEAFADDTVKCDKAQTVIFVCIRLLFQGHKKWKLCGKGLTHSLIHHFETAPNSKKLQTTTEMRLLKDFMIQIA